MKNVLITGAAGFIGSHLAESLIKEGNFVIGVDNFLTGSRGNVERLKKVADEMVGSAPLLRRASFALCVAPCAFHELDVTDGSMVSFLNGKYDSIDRVYHLACPASPKDFKNLGVEILEVCSKGTMNIIDLAEKKKARFLLASTSEVYGDPLETPQTEHCLGNVNVLGPRSCYDEGKRFAESYIINFSKKHKIDFRIARIFNTYGEYMRKDDGRVIPNFIEQLREDRPITIQGDGSQTRAFCYVKDMVEGLKLLMEYQGFDENVNQNEPVERVFNLGNPHEVRILELAKTLAKIMGKELNAVAIPLPQDDPKQRCPEVSKAEKVLGFKAKVELEDGLKRTLELWR